MVGDGYTLVRHCENADVSGGCFEPDAGPIYCTMSDEPESTEQNRVWRDGPPPHVGWWNASSVKNKDNWSWWNGEHWSSLVGNQRNAECAGQWATVHFPHRLLGDVQWTDYWPADARVPRLAPEDFEVGARWVCVKPLFTNDFVGMELRVSEIRAHTLQWKGPCRQHQPRR